ncbi:cation-translocating P-type ATPase [Halorientalis salina]|uniref:cation-translocating P-type ATPase n=1 Tax=Halorientalis salina TaxID=2932266 RepID=UPI0010AC0063|nr:HAD-IC family P-type ATPase [Halorientalis salina]
MSRQEPTSTGDNETEHWHTRDAAEIYETCDSAPDGLTAADAARRRAEYGPNELPAGEVVTWWEILLRQFKSPLIYILAIAAAVSVAIGELTDAGFIVAVLAINAIIGGLQEWQAERSSQALQELIRTRATVLRDGDAVEIDGEDVVPGDIVLLESGFRVPADIRLTQTHELAVDESPLTGESESVSKDEDWQGAPADPLGDRRNMAYSGTVVTRGRGRGVVVGTGAETAVGRLAEDVTAVEGGNPPLVARMERFTQLISIAVVVAAVFVALVGIFFQGYSVVEMFLFAVALAVSAIPEGLPVGMTVALGVASRRMADVGVIVRRLVAVEGLGSCTLIATDKTGTLTANELTVRTVRLPDGTDLDVTGEGYEPDGAVRRDGAVPGDAVERLARAAALCNEGTLHHRDGEWTWRGDPTDIALLSFSRKAGITRETALAERPQVDEIPFESEQRFAATYHRGPDDETIEVYVKGAPERVLEMCDGGATGSQESTDRLLNDATDLAEDGYRVLAVAAGVLDAPYNSEEPPTEPAGLTFLGFVGMIDPLREGVAEAIASAKAAGIGVTMVTGDHPETALAIARDLGLAEEDDDVVTGADLADVPDDELRERVRTTRVFARVSPSQKLDIVEAARETGHFVAVTGDGVNDAPALRQANIGIAMGESGTDVARDAAELIISDDNFATIVAGIRQGRIAYDNIRKVIYLLVSTGAGEVLLVLLALAAGMPLPLAPVQILWLNLVTNGVQDVALAFEPEENDVLDRPPRDPDERIFNRLMGERTVVAALAMGVFGFLTFSWLLDSGLSETAVRNHVLLLFVLFEIVNIGNARSETISMLRLSPLRSPILLTGTLAAFLIHVGAMYYPPAQRVLESAPVDPRLWVALGAIALTVGVAIEMHKLYWRRRASNSGQDGDR